MANSVADHRVELLSPSDTTRIESLFSQAVRDTASKVQPSAAAADADVQRAFSERLREYTRVIDQETASARDLARVPVLVEPRDERLEKEVESLQEEIERLAADARERRREALDDVRAAFASGGGEWARQLGQRALQRSEDEEDAHLVEHPTDEQLAEAVDTYAKTMREFLQVTAHSAAWRKRGAEAQEVVKDLRPRNATEADNAILRDYEKLARKRKSSIM